MKRTLLRTLVLSALLIGTWACKPAAHSHDHSHDHDHDHAHHDHVAPHGGAAVVLGEEAFHLELVVDHDEGLLTAYVLDGEMETFIRVNLPAIELVVTEPMAAKLTLTPVANPATGETKEQTSQFEARADWLKTTKRFAGTLPTLTVRGQTFSNVAFRFPEGHH